MLSINTRKYEIEEDIILNNENGEEIFKFKMQLTAEDLKRLKNALIGKDTLKIASKIKSLEKSELDEEKTNEVLELAEKMNEEAKELIEKLCFKNNKGKFIELGGESKYDEMVEIISDFLLMNFMKKQINRTNTMTSDLAKITKK